MKKLVVISMLLLFSAAWWSAVSNIGVKTADYKKHIAAAEQYENQQIYYDAILEYKSALEDRPESGELWLKIAQAYRNLGSDDEFEQACSQAINAGDGSEDAVFVLADYYLDENRRADAIALLKRQAENTRYNGAVLEKLQSLAGDFNIISGDYDGISTTRNGCMAVKSGEQYGFLDENGQELIRPQYQSVGLFGETGFAPVQKDDQYYYIDSNNYKRRQPKESYQYLGVMCEGVLPAQKDGKWGYLDENFKPVTDFVYDAATPFLNGIAAVKQGEKWALMGSELKPFTEFGFSDVIRDDWGFCSRNGVVFVKSGDSYILLNAEGTQLGKESFENASPFLSELPAAVMQDGKWGFVSVTGEKTLECAFQNAKSFSSIGYAPVAVGDYWGYIKQNGDTVIDAQFDDAKAFNSQGIAPVKIAETWKLIQLDIY